MASPQHDLLRFLVVLLYIPALYVAFRKLLPRLPAYAKTLLTALLAAQIVVVALSVQLQTQDSVIAKLVDVTEERNPAAALAGLQLGLVAGYSLLTAWLARARPIWQRQYFVCLSAMFFYLAADELFVLHEGIDNWIVYYAVAGSVIAAVTAFVARCSPRRALIWHACFLAGLAVSAFGAMALELLRFPGACRPLGLYYIDKCLLKYIEEPLEYFGIWLALAAALGLLSELAPPPKRLQRFVQYCLPAVALLLIVYTSDPDLKSAIGKTGAVPANISFEAGARVHAYQLELPADAEAAELTLWLSTRLFGYDGLGYSIHLLDQASGATLDGKDEYATVTAGSVLGPFYLPIFRQTLQLSLPAEARANRAYWLVLRLWRESEGAFASQRVVESDRRMLSDTQVVLDELVIRAAPIAAPAVTRARFDNGFELYAADAPASAKPGASLKLTMIWQAEADGAEDFTQFLHFVHEETGEQWAFDQQPLGARLPTRLWYSGLADSEDWLIPLPADLAPGRYRLWTGLYRPSNLARLGASDADGAPYPDARVPLGVIDIEAA